MGFLAQLASGSLRNVIAKSCAYDRTGKLVEQPDFEITKPQIVVLGRLTTVEQEKGPEAMCSKSENGNPECRNGEYSTGIHSMASLDHLVKQCV